MRVQMEPDWREHVLAATDELFEDELGPRMQDAAREYVPVLRGYLRDGIRFFLEGTDGHSLILWASSVEGGADREYAYYVETGHRNVAWGVPPPHANGHDFVEAEPFLRPTLYQTWGP